jgi:protoporphyrinogen oxidase
MTERKAIIIGAGPAGLTAAYELLTRTDIVPVVYEASDMIGGISRTVDYKGNKIDIGGHRFFSKSEQIVKWWLDILPLQGGVPQDAAGLLTGPAAGTNGPDPDQVDSVMLWRWRQSRILYSGKLFDYPISPSLDTISKLGAGRMTRIGSSYLLAKARPIRPERSLEDFLVNRFGRELYRTFFKDYTEKLWGVPCNQINPSWGAQRIKGLSLTKAFLDAVKHLTRKSDGPVETSLIRYFMYPKYGPGQLWTEVAHRIEREGGRIHMRHTVIGLTCRDNRVTGVTVRDEASGKVTQIDADYVVSSMPVRDLVSAMTPGAPAGIREVSDGLVYRDFITVGLLLKHLRTPKRRTSASDGLARDCWIYIQEPYVKVGRMQIFNNWSPYLVRDRNTTWVGLEYFCTEGDALWNTDDAGLTGRAVQEMVAMGFIDKSDVLDSTVIRMPKAYPAYFGTYDRFDEVRRFTDSFENLFLVGRNGMHRYNNSDHSMLSAMTAVDHIAQGATSKDEIWAVNPEGEYHEAVTRSQAENHKPDARKGPGPHEIREWSTDKDSSESLPEKSRKAS